MLVTNRAVGPRMFWEKAEDWTADKPSFKPQQTILFPGETRDLNLAADAFDKNVVYKAWKASGDIEVGAPKLEPEPPPSSLDGMTDDELRAYLKDRGVGADGRWGREKLLAEAKAVQARG